MQSANVTELHRPDRVNSSNPDHRTSNETLSNEMSFNELSSNELSSTEMSLREMSSIEIADDSSRASSESGMCEHESG